MGEEAGALFEQVAPKRPLYAHIGKMAMSGVPVDTIRDAMLGVDMAASGADKTIKLPSTTERHLLFVEAGLDALGPHLQEQRAMIAETAEKIFLAKAARGGVSTAEGFEGTNAGLLYVESLKEASGKTRYGGGFAKYRGQSIALPPGVTERQFSDVLGRANEDDWRAGAVGGGRSVDVDGEPILAHRMRGARLEVASDGQYLVNLAGQGDAPLYAGGNGPSGYYVLDFEAMREAQGDRLSRERQERLSSGAAVPTEEELRAARPAEASGEEDGNFARPTK